VRCARCPTPGRHGGILFKLLILLAVAFAAAALAWMFFLPLVLTTQLRQRTGFDASVRSLAVNPFTGTVEVRGLVLANPPTFPVRDFVEVREFYADADMFSLLSERPVISTVMLDVATVTLVKRENGQTNADVFQHNLTLAADGEPRPPPSHPLRFLVRRLTVRIDRLVIADHSTKMPTTREYRIGLNQNYTDVTELRQLFAPAALLSLAPVGAALHGLVPGDLGRALNESVLGTSKLGAGWLKEMGRKAGQKAKEYFDALEESKKP
jgi:hypothetical protein